MSSVANAINTNVPESHKPIPGDSVFFKGLAVIPLIGDWISLRVNKELKSEIRSLGLKLAGVEKENSDYIPSCQPITPTERLRLVKAMDVRNHYYVSRIFNSALRLAAMIALLAVSIFSGNAPLAFILGITSTLTIINIIQSIYKLVQAKRTTCENTLGGYAKFQLVAKQIAHQKAREVNLISDKNLAKIRTASTVAKSGTLVLDALESIKSQLTKASNPVEEPSGSFNPKAVQLRIGSKSYNAEEVLRKFNRGPIIPLIQLIRRNSFENYCLEKRLLDLIASDPIATRPIFQEQDLGRRVEGYKIIDPEECRKNMAIWKKFAGDLV